MIKLFVDRICQILLAILLIIGFSSQAVAQEKNKKDSLNTTQSRDTTKNNLKKIKTKISQDTSFVKKDLDTLSTGESKSGYDDKLVLGGANSVGADLIANDKKKGAWFNINYAKKVFNSYYDVKRFLNKKYGLAIGVDYSFLNQFATYSSTENQASSGIFRIYGSWTPKFKNKNANGSFVYKLENRHNIGPGVTPRNLGYDAGAALSTATFKDFGWGLTNLYWKQFLMDRRIGLAIGIMDPGDWLDLYPLLSPFKYYLNEAYFNSPAMSIPNQGLGVSFAFKQLYKEMYLAGGLHDANGEPFMFVVDNFNSFFQVKEYLWWVETGWNFGKNLTDGESIHLMYWHQDPRSAKQQTESWGLCFSASQVFSDQYTVFVRAGYSEGNAPLMSTLVMAGMSIKVMDHDLLAIGLSYGTPSDRSRRAQFGTEVFYTFQITEHLNVSPNVQLTVNPSFNEEKKAVGVFSVFRILYSL